jgi:hypothetical protein
MGKTIEGENASYVMLLDPSTETPIGSVNEPVPVQQQGAITLDDGWTVDAFIDEAGDDSSKQWTVPAGRIWHVFWVAVKLATTATVGSRQIEVRVQRAGVSMFTVLARCGVTQAASLTYEYTLAPGVPDLTAVRDNVAPSNAWVATPIPVTTILRAGDTLRVWDNKSIAGAADDMSAWVQYAWAEV